MKRIITLTIILMALTAYTTLQVQSSDPAATEILGNMPNPASVYCTQNGNTLVPAADGSACDEWAYFRGECCPAAQEFPTPAMIVEGSGGGGPGRSDGTEEATQAVTCHPVPQKR